MPSVKVAEPAMTRNGTYTRSMRLHLTNRCLDEGTTVGSVILRARKDAIALDLESKDDADRAGRILHGGTV